MWDADKVKQLRLKQMLTQEEFAIALDVGVNSVIRWEKGTFTPSFKAQKKLVAFCNERKMKWEE